MQERYLGDIHDFHKFLFLKFIKYTSSLNLGLNFYNVNPKILGKNEVSKNDGEKRKYLNNDRYRKLDQLMIKEFTELVSKKNRKFKSFIKYSHLKKYINFYHDEIRLNDRKIWFKNSMIKLKNCDIIFLDPDNGLIPKSVKKKSMQSLKYVLFDELSEILATNKVVIFSQSQSYSKYHKTFLKEKINEISDNINISVNFPIIRNRTSPNSFFFTISKDIYFNEINSLLKKYANFHGNIELIDPLFITE